MTAAVDGVDGLQKIGEALVAAQARELEYRKQVAVLSERCATYAVARDSHEAASRKNETRYKNLAAAARAVVDALEPQNDEQRKLLDALTRLL